MGVGEDVMQLIVRKKYLDELIELYGTPDIKVITGIRRSGKSVLLQEFITYLKSLNEQINIVMINLQELEFDHLLEYHALHKYIMNQYKEEMTNVLLIDEVQMCPQFELAINSIYAKGIYDIYITGSNAFLLSSDLATLFTGRTMEIKVYPFSFKEYLTYYKITDGYDDAFDQYVKIGGMPGAYAYKTEDRQYDYVRDVYSTILIRDLVEKYKIRNKLEFTNISEFMMDNIGNLLSPNNICKTLKNDQSEITRKTVSKYIGYLENAFLFYEAKRYDLKGKKYLTNNSKYYLCDSSFRYAVNGTRNMDFGRVYENIVYLELRRRDYEVYVGKLYKKDNGYGQFLSMLGYKLEERGKHLIKVDRYFASSKICSVCGHKKKELALSDRMYVCECGNRMDRDVNAAVNIREEGKRIYKECA